MLQNIKHKIYDFFPFPTLVLTGKTRVEKVALRDKDRKEKTGLASVGGLE